MGILTTIFDTAPDVLMEIFSPIQLIGYLGMACAFISYQCKKNSTYFIFQASCSVFFALQFALLGGWSGFFLNLFSIARGLILGAGKKLHKWYFLALIEASFILSSVLAVAVFAEPWWIALILFVAQGGGTFAMWTHDGKKIRITQFFLISPLWLFHNSYYAFSIGGILCETFNMISVIISFIRFRKTGFDKQ